LEGVLERAADAGATGGGYVVLRLAAESRTFPQWLDAARARLGLAGDEPVAPECGNAADYDMKWASG